ncbi:hypothetical protein VCR15J2_390002 [Vibrio coralliirubri]|uniref:DUF2460 domain-containing protein n=1 Tax=Vibrio coralliirubri TaxID=1516159 RepID=UPI0006335CC8|nr:DUF2460 domain-containing protein [Vibrio coralliirubri]CDT52508.1 hypothetical protein VCR15J2_390002 [Vibrio coralliirubri]
MSQPTYPKLSDKPDRSKYGINIEDPALKNDMEGGYVASRPRFYRKPRRTFSFGYTMLHDDDYKKLLSFWDEVKGGSEMFEYTDFDDGKVYMVRFKEQFAGKFVGKGIAKYWDVTGIILEEV